MVSVPEQEIVSVASPSKKRVSGVQMTLIQSACCTVLVLLFWIFRTIGGDGYMQLRDSFHKALQNNALLSTVSGLFTEQTPEESYVVEEEETTVTTQGTNLE